MPRSLPLLAAALLLGVTACSTPTEPDYRQQAVDWLAEQPTVARAVVEPTVYADDTGDWIRVETTPDLPDAEVRALVAAMQEGVASYDTYDESVLLSVDGFETIVYPSSEPAVLDPALWLRGDGRAESAAIGDYPDYVVTAEPCVVFGLVGDFDERAGDQARTTREVRSADGSTRVQWTRSDDLGMQLPRDAVGQLDALCTRYPGTRGWVEGVAGRFTEVEGAVLLDPDDVALDEVVADVDALVHVADFPKGLLLGWGGMRAPATSFADVYSGERREWAEAALDAGADRVFGWGEPESSDTRLSQVQVTDLAAWERVHDRLLEEAGPEYLPIDLFRELPEEDNLPVDGEIHSAVTPLPRDSVERTLVREVAGIDALREVSAQTSIRLIVGGDADDDVLDQLLTATAEAYPRLDEDYLPDGVQAQFIATEGFGQQETYRIVGTVVDGEFVPDPQAVAEGSTLPERYAAAWERVS